MNQRLWSLISVMLLVAGCSARITIAPPNAANPLAGIRPGHWEGTSPSISFDITEDGKLRNFKLVGSMPMGNCTLTVDEIAIGSAGSWEVGQSNDSAVHVTGKPNNATTFTGTYKIRLCKGSGDKVSVVLDPQDKPWKAAWKGELAGQGPGTSVAARPLPPTSAATQPPAQPTVAPTQAPRTAPTAAPTLAKPTAALASAGAWQQIKSLPRGIQSFAVDPANPRILYAGTGDSGSGSGVYKSQDGGQNWELAASGLPSEDVYALAISSSTPGTLYAMVGVRGYVFSSSDGAKTWTRAGDSTLFGGYTRRLVIVPGKAQSLFSLTLGSAMARSSDGGHAWTPVKNGIPADDHSVFVQSLAIDPRNSNTLYLGTGGFVGGGHGVFKSTDGGENWSAANRDMIDYRITALAVDPAQPQTIYAGSDAGELFKSTDGAQSWTELTDKLPVPKNQHTGIRHILLDPASPGTLYITCDQVGVLVSADGGQTWKALGKPSGDNYYTFTAMTVLSGPKPTVILGVERAGAWRYTVD